MLAGAGVPFELALALEDYERIAMCVMIGELNGGKFDWERMKWEKV